MFDNFKNLVFARQSCREFSDKQIERDKLDKIMELSMLAPSACNSQPWKMVCAVQKDSVKAVCECLQEKGHNKFLDGAKAYVAVINKNATLKDTVQSKFDRNRFVKYDVGELVAYITLSAKSLGIDSCIIGWMNEEKLASVLGLEQNEKCEIVVALGYSDIPTREKKRKDKEEIIKYI
ncbi:MAG: nitroreductase family protein [Clostridia bacterium]|nr:nitroreductase family protein [Clostridia bacterium]